MLKTARKSEILLHQVDGNRVQLALPPSESLSGSNMSGQITPMLQLAIIHFKPKKYKLQYGHKLLTKDLINVRFC